MSLTFIGPIIGNVIPIYFPQSPLCRYPCHLGSSSNSQAPSCVTLVRHLISFVSPINRLQRFILIPSSAHEDQRAIVLIFSSPSLREPEKHDTELVDRWKG